MNKDYSKKMEYSKRIIDDEGYTTCSLSKLTNKVTFKLSKNMIDIFSNPLYAKFFKLLRKISNELDEELEFYVEVDYMTLEAFKVYISMYGYEKLHENIGTKIFELMTDLTLQGFCYTPKNIADRFLTNTDLNNFKEYYANNKDVVYRSFKNGYTSLYNYEIMYKEKNPNSILSNLFSIIADKSQPKLKRDFASNLWIEFQNELSKAITERSKNNLCNSIIKINNNINKIDYKKYSNRSDLDIELISENL